MAFQKQYSKNIAFHLLPIWQQTLVAIDSESRQTSFSSFCAAPSEVAVLLKVVLQAEQAPFPLTGRWLRSAALHRIRLGTCGIVPMLYVYSETNEIEWMIESLSEAMGAAFVGNKFSGIPSKFSFHMKKKWLSAARNLQSIKTFLTLELRLTSYWVIIARVVACFPQASLSLPAATAADSETLVFVPELARLTRPSSAGERFQELGCWFGPLNLDYLLEQPSERLPDDLQAQCRDSNLDSNLNSAAWPTSCKGPTKGFITSEITA